ncbi:hypothetical protein EZS27_032801 [termite gut metagenome]|uniref:ASCH domain-containing protein n=1 Tax=termite gut metagenome TaxID=433724 RepID=A0A5J4Q5R1_9ZZZZ
MIAVITLSKTFFTGHPRKDEETGFREKVIEGTKIHSCRQNYEYWELKIKRLKKADGVLSIRQWSDKPFCGKQEIITEVPADVVGIQKLCLWRGFEHPAVIGREIFSINELAKNDGLSLEDYQSWLAPAFKENKEDSTDKGYPCN